MKSESNELSLLKAYCWIFEKPEQHQKKIKLWTTLIVLGSFVGFAVVWSLAGKERISTENALAVSFIFGIFIGGGAIWRYSADQLTILTKYFEPKRELIESRIEELSQDPSQPKE